MSWRERLHSGTQSASLPPSSRLVPRGCRLSSLPIFSLESLLSLTHVSSSLASQSSTFS